MSTELDDETLQRFYDGDLSPVEERVVRSRVEQDPSAQKRLQELERLSSLIQLAAEEVGSSVDSAAMFDSIEKQLDAEGKQGASQRLRVVAGDWVADRKRVLFPLVAVAAAAAFAVIALTPRDAGDDAAARAAQKRERTRLAELAPSEPASTMHGTRVENVDFGKNTGTVFEIDTAGVATAVVWIAEDEEEAP